MTDLSTMQMPRFRGVARKLVLATVLFSSLLALLVTAFNLYERYRYDVNLIEKSFVQIHDVHLKSITNNLWVADKTELQVQLNGILKIADIQRVEVYDKGKLWVSAGPEQEKNIRTRDYPLVYVYKDKALNIGSLRIIASLDSAYEHVFNSLWITLATNGVKTFLVSFFMLFLFHNLVVRHLHTISRDVACFDVSAPLQSIKLLRKESKPGQEDEFDMLVEAFDHLQEELKSSFTSIEKKVNERTMELMLAKEEAILASNAKTEFLSRMSHELRTPMNAVLGFSQLLLLEDSLTEEQKDQLNEIVMAGNHLLKLINEILDLSRIESGSMELDIKPVSISGVFDESISLLRPLLEERNITLDNEIKDKHELYVEAEPFRLKQTVINLLSNAIKYNKDNGAIAISCEQDHDRLRINVRDTGIGMTEEQLQQVFEPFNRAGLEESYTEGTGIGLTISKRLAQLMGGDLGVESVAGEGSCFYLLLKKVEPEKAEN